MIVSRSNFDGKLGRRKRNDALVGMNLAQFTRAIPRDALVSTIIAPPSTCLGEHVDYMYINMVDDEACNISSDAFMTSFIEMVKVAIKPRQRVEGFVLSRQLEENTIDILNLTLNEVNKIGAVTPIIA